MGTESGWLEAEAEHAPEQTSRAWRADKLASAGLDAPEALYVAVDEIVEGHVGLVVSEWPWFDPQGRIVFAGRTERIGCELRDLNGHLARNRRLASPAPGSGPSWVEVVKRSAAIGDVFAVARSGDDRLVEPGTPLDEWMAEPLDLTAEGREAAKVSLYGAVAGPPLGETELTELQAEAKGVEDEPGPAAPAGGS